MGVRLCCPTCGHAFRIHGYEAVTTCYECDTTFNPDGHRITPDTADWRQCPAHWCEKVSRGKNTCPYCGTETHPVFDTSEVDD